MQFAASPCQHSIVGGGGGGRKKEKMEQAAKALREFSLRGPGPMHEKQDIINERSNGGTNE